MLAGPTILFVSLGLIYSYGIMQLHLYKAHLASVSTLAFIGSVGSSMSPLIGMIVARIIGRIGYRATACMGGLFLGLGEFTAGFATRSVPAMFVTQGVIFGIGAGLLFLVRWFLARAFFGRWLKLLAAGGDGSFAVVQKEARAGDWCCICRRWSRVGHYGPFSGQVDNNGRACKHFEVPRGCGMVHMHSGVLLS